MPMLLRHFTVSPAECAEYMWHAVFTTTAGHMETFRMGANGEDMGKWRYFGNEAQRRMLWAHTVQLVDRTLDTVSGTSTV